MTALSEWVGRTLLVEDNPADAILIGELLLPVDGGPAPIVRVPTLAAAEETLGREAFEVILLDLRLPDGFGVQCVKRMRAAAPAIPIVALTGMEGEEIALACIEAGAQDYVSKQDLQPQALRRALAYAVARAGERTERLRADALELRLAAIVKGSSDAIISATPEGAITSWNAGAEQIFGYEAGEALGEDIDGILRLPPDSAALELGLVAERDDRPDDLRQPGVYEAVRQRRDGTLVCLSVASTELRDAAGSLQAFAVTCRDVTEGRRRDAELRRRNLELLERDRQMRALTARLNAVREDERTRISRTVHDELGQQLTGIKMDLRWCERRLGEAGVGRIDPAEVRARLADAERLVDRTVETVQRVALELRPSILDVLGLGAAMRDEVRRFAQRLGIEQQVETDDAVGVDPDIATALFRTLQELLANVARHARAQSVSVTLAVTGREVVLEVADDGVGVDLERVARADSLGLLGIRERVADFGGRVRLARGTMGGTLAVVTVPWPKRACVTGGVTGVVTGGATVKEMGHA